MSKSRPMKILLKKYSCFLIYQTSNMVEINLYALKFFFRSAKEAFGLKRKSKATGAGKRMEILIIFIFLPNANACGLWPFLYHRLFFKGLSCSSLIYSAFLHFKQNSVWNSYIVTEDSVLQEKGSGFLFQPLQSFTLESHISKELSETWPRLTGNIGVSHISHQTYHGNETAPIHLFFQEYFASTYCVLLGLGGQLVLFQISSMS